MINLKDILETNNLDELISSLEEKKKRKKKKKKIQKKTI